MNDEQYDFLRRMVETTGPSGYEWDAQLVWRERIQDVAISVKTDTLGNCIAALNPAGRPRIMIDAHIDEIGFLVRYIDDDGFLYFAPIGGFDGSTLPGCRVRIMGKDGPVMGIVGRKPIHLLTPDERKIAPELKSMWIDIGAAGREAAEAVVSVGNAGGRAHGFTRLQGNVVACNSMDDRVGAYVIAETFRALAGSDVRAGVWASSSTMEEIGLRGARVSSYDIEAEIGIAVEVTWTSDHPQAPKTELGDVQVGKGPVICVGANTNPRIFERLVGAAQAEGVPYQVDADPAGTGTDMNVMQMSRHGMATGLISVPTRYLHTASEIVSLDDVDASVTVLTRFVRDLEEGVNLTP
jgi:putative aminopeptidase FrvX